MSTANYMQLPINRPLHRPHNNQRDGFMQFNVNKGRVAYYPNALQDNTPSVVAPKDGGYIEYPEKMSASKQRGKHGKFNDHFSQAQLFYNSLTTAEQQQLVDGARFEIGKCDSPIVRQNMVAILNQVDNNLACRVARAVGVTEPDKSVDNKLKTSEGLSIENFKKPNHIKTKKVAILTAPGIDEKDAKRIHDYLTKNGAYVDYIGFHLDEGLSITQTYTTSSSVLYDGVYVPAGSPEAFESLTSTNAMFPYNEPSMFVLDAYRHGKPIAASGKEAYQFLKESKVPIYNDTTEQVKFGVLTTKDDIESKFKSALIKQRFWNRLPTDPDANLSPTKTMD
jgi:catalase